MANTSGFNEFTYWKKGTTTKVNYDKRGRLNTGRFNDFVTLCRRSQKALKGYLMRELVKYYSEDNIISDDGFIYVVGTNSNVLLTAHMDTVHKTTCKDVYEYYNKKEKKHILSSPQGIGGDDRCGIYTIMRILATTDHRPYILFCEDEEIGGIGSKKFCENNDLVGDVMQNITFMVEIDRANANDAVFYEEDNREFQKYVMEITGNKEAYGSFSDICHLSEATDISSFNISCGYYNAHTTSEYVVMEELEDCVQKVIKLIETNNEDGKAFQFEPFRWAGYSNSFNYSYGYGYGSSSDNYTGKNLYEFQYMEDTRELLYAYYEGDSLEACVGQFLMDNPTLRWNDIIDYQEY